MQNKVVVAGKVNKLNGRKFKIDKGGTSEVDVTVEIIEDGQYVVEKLSIEGLPSEMHDGKPIHWFNNFAIKAKGRYINQRYRVTVPGIGKSQLVIYDGNGDPYYYTGKIENDTFELTDGDPAIGKTT
ncbi:MAG TPA: hypothetical protein PLF42_15645 [Anaerolineales bacterium]|nr:hypothetical protein [Anaerolineales bacterium]